jgi:hypothetical protein
LLKVEPSEVRALPIKIAHLDDVQGIPQEAKWLIGFWLGRGRSSPALQPSSWMKTAIGGPDRKGFWGIRMRTRIAQQVKHIRHWKIFHESYENAPDVEATWHIDPPYQQAGKAYRKKDIDYAALATWCQSRRGQVMVCEQMGATWLPFRKFVIGDSAYCRRASRKRMTPEVIWIRNDRKIGFGFEKNSDEYE